MRIDAHQHYWRLDRGDYGWLSPELGTLYRDFLPEDLEPHLRERGIDKTIVVQAAPTLEETKFLLGLADRSDSILGVVGWVDFESDSFEEQFETIAKHPKLVGIRIMLQDLEDARYVLRPAILERIRWLADRDFPVDLLVKEHQLPAIGELVERIPHLRGVVDHIGKPNIAAKSWSGWASDMERIAANPNVYCKLSGMVTEADHANWTVEDFGDYIDFTLSAFGPQRVMFGSDWPVCLLAASYSQVAEIVEDRLANLYSADIADVMGTNALTFYKLLEGIRDTSVHARKEFTS
ncbi:amidohydrolase family protein [Cohnella mopanensis]|uniref:amidohydrolase family protein n=1 Tax=Cohnella mopanensis TaxID=2911966 RepID=UPI001EF774BA|nr:amidohydrolase family protein [Cohnella mopanensis]